jgi:DNA-binding beta-propeller fold protein YncE
MDVPCAKIYRAANHLLTQMNHTSQAINYINSASSLFSIMIGILLLSLYLGQTGSLIPTVDASNSAKNYTFLMALDSPNFGDEETNIEDLLPQPEGIDVDRDGNVFVNEIGENRINIFDANGTLKSTWGSSGEDLGQFSHPHGNEVEDENNEDVNDVYIYIADQNNDRIQKFSKDGTFITTWGEEGEGNGQFLHTHGIDLDSDGNVYVSDRDQPSIQKFSSDGTFIKKWGSEGTADGQFIQPWDVSVSHDDRIFVPDFGNNRIQIFSKDGDFITSWGAAGSGPGQFDGPAVVAFDSEDNVYVTDSGNHRVQKFTSDGTFITEWGEEGQSNGQFSMPEGLAVDTSSGKVYVSDTSNNNVQVFAPSES